MATKTKPTAGGRPSAPAPASTGSGEGAGAGFFPAAWLIGSYLVLSVLFFLPALMPGRTIFGTDYLAISYIFEEFVTGRFAAGELPSWMPYVYGGVPFFANPMDIYYPVTLLLRLIQVPTHHHLALIFVVQYFLAGTGVYLLLRELGAGRLPAWLAGLLYMFSGYLISYIYGGHEGRAIVATLAPLFLFALHRAVRTGGLRWFVLAGVVLGGANLSNQIQSTYYLLLAGGLWGIFCLWRLDAWRPGRALASRLAGAALSLAVGFGLAAINFLPFLGYVDASPRGGPGRGYDYATSWSMPPGEIVGLAVPERTGFLELYVGQNPMKLHTEYAGALALLALVAGVWLLRRNRYAWFFLGLSAFTLTIAFGGHTPIYRLWYELLPGTSRFRAPSISFYLVSLSVAVLAGLALDRLASLRAGLASRAAEARRAAEEDYRAVLYAGAGALALVLVWGLAVAAGSPAAPTAAPRTPEELEAAKAALIHPTYLRGVWRFFLFLALSAGGLWLWLRGHLSHRAAGVLLALVAAADLWLVDKKFFETVPEPSVSLAADEVVDFLRSQPGPFRTFVYFDLPQDNYLPHHGLELVGGEHGNQLQSYNEFLGAGETTYTDYHNILSDPRFMALANARYFVTGQRLDVPFLRPVFEGRTRQGSMATVYENTVALPRAFLVASATRAPEPDGALDRMLAPDFDPTSEVVLYEEPPLPASGADPGLAAAAPPGTARVVRHDPAEVAVEVAADRPAYLVLLDNHYEGWTARVDGADAPVLRANHTFRAVPVPAGQHTVRFRFQPAGLRAGLGVSAALAALLAAYGLALAARAWRRRAPAPA